MSSQMPPSDLDGEDGVAIIGIACRFPGASNSEQFWQNIRQGVESISVFSDAEVLEAGVDPAQLTHPHYIRAGAVLDEIEKFDAAFFGYSPLEAAATDPQQRLFLELAWQAFEDAGYDVSTYQGKVGVFAGSSVNTYLPHLLANTSLLQSLGGEQIEGLNEEANLATRISYKLNLQGPSFTVHTASSTSLAATCVAYHSLLSYQCDMALAGGVSIQIPQKTGYIYHEDGIFSPDGHCRTFDSKAQGTVLGNGLGIVVLKRLIDAVAERDHIYAVIRGASMNNDGARKVGFHAPSLQGQTEVIAEALALAGIEPETISYVEAHGTGTPLGDPIEVAALTQVIGSRTTKTQFCALGSVKPNIGHLNVAAGSAGLIKTALALYHKELPPSINFQVPNPQIDFAHSPFYVNTVLSPWNRSATPRRAGVSSLGVGGTNVHLVLEEAPVFSRLEPMLLPKQLLVLSAKSDSALDAASLRLAAYLDTHRSLSLADVAYTLQAGRQALSHRRFCLCSDIADAIKHLSVCHDDDAVVSNKIIDEQRPHVAFLFPGQGVNYVGMGQELYHTFPVFRQCVDECALLLAPLLQRDIRTVLYPNKEQQKASDLIEEPSFAQPILFVIEYALARLWMDWGIRPQAMLGHSLGEYTAACLSGVLSLPDALKLLVCRGKLSQQLPAGAMLAVALPPSELLSQLDDHLTLAAINGPSQCVVSGPEKLVEKLEQRLKRQGAMCHLLNTGYAWHSAMIDAILPTFLQQCNEIHLQAPQLPYLSCVTGTWIDSDQVTDPSYWGQHFRLPVLFDQALEKLLQHPHVLVLEVGPGHTLRSLSMQRLKQMANPYYPLSSLPEATDTLSDLTCMMQSLGKLWLSGVPVAWQAFHLPFSGRRVPLPPYPFESQRHWIELPHKTLPFPASQKGIDQVEYLPSESLIRSQRPQLSRDYTAPHSQTEQTIASIWQEVFGIERIGVHDDFFALGGHSLLAVHLADRLRVRLQVDLSLRDLLEHSTVESLARTLDERTESRRQEEQRKRLEIWDVDAENRQIKWKNGLAGFPLSFAQQRYWFLSHLHHNIPYNQIHALHIRGPFVFEVFAKCIFEMIRRYAILRTTLAVIDGQPVQIIAPATHNRLFTFSLIDLRGLDKQEQERERRGWCLSEGAHSFQIERGPALRTTFLHLAPYDYTLFLVIPYMFADSRAMNLLVHELKVLYSAFQVGEPSPLEEPAQQYVNYALRQHQLLENGQLRTEIAYWSEQLAQMSGALTLITDRERPLVETFQRDLAEVDLRALTGPLKTLARLEATTLFTTLLTLFRLVMYSYNCEEDLCIGIFTFDHVQADFAKIPGHFAHLVPLRCRLSGNPTFQEILRDVQTKVVEAQAYQTLPFATLLSLLRPYRAIGDSSLIPLLFTFNVLTHDQDRESEDKLPEKVFIDYSMESADTEASVADCDMSLNLWEESTGLCGQLKYQRSLFEPATITSLVRKLEMLAEYVTLHPNVHLSELIAKFLGTL